MSEQWSKDCILFIELEHLKIKRENALLVLNKSFLLYALFLIIGVIGFVNNYVNVGLLNVIVIFSILVLLIGVIVYFRVMRSEEASLQNLLTGIKKEVKK